MEHRQIIAASPITPMPDRFGIGQQALARIACDVAQDEMGRCALSAFGTGYAIPLIRASARTRFHHFRAEYERAKAIKDAFK